MRVLGIDPGSHTTGYGIVELSNNSVRHVDNGQIRTDSKLPLSERLHFIFTNLETLVKTHKPDVLAIENLFVAKNARSSLLLGHARGVSILAGSINGLKIFEYTPAEVKLSVVGQGRAEKYQVQQMVKVMLNLPEIAAEDASDALAVAICHCNTSRFLQKVRESEKK